LLIPGKGVVFVATEASSPFKGHRYPPEIINHCVWLYHRFSLSLRDIEVMMCPS
jgi:transposase-like protein